MLARGAGLRTRSAVSLPELGAGFAWIDAATTPIVLVQHWGPNFTAAAGALEQSCLPRESGTESFPERKSRDARVEPQGTGNRPHRAAERWDAGIRGPGVGP